jgi:hypothetical protein
MICLAILDEESSAYRKECALGENSAGLIERCEAHAVRMPRVGSGRIHLVTMKDQVARLVEFDSALARKLDAPRSANRSDSRLDRRRIDGGRLIAGQAEKDSAIGPVTEAGKSERAI